LDGAVRSFPLLDWETSKNEALVFRPLLRKSTERSYNAFHLQQYGTDWHSSISLTPARIFVFLSSFYRSLFTLFTMRHTFVLGALLISGASTAFAQSFCPSDTASYTVRNGTSIAAACCKLPFTTSLGATCTVNVDRIPTRQEDRYWVSCNFMKFGTFNLLAGADVDSLRVVMLGGIGGSVANGKTFGGGIPSYVLLFFFLFSPWTRKTHPTF
jgi:hypothetical protein